MGLPKILSEKGPESQVGRVFRGGGTGSRSSRVGRGRVFAERSAQVSHFCFDVVCEEKEKVSTLLPQEALESGLKKMVSRFIQTLTDLNHTYDKLWKEINPGLEASLLLTRDRDEKLRDVGKLDTSEDPSRVTVIQGHVERRNIRVKTK